MSDNSQMAVPENKMGTMPVVKLIFNMSLPIMFSMLVMAMYNIVDSIFVAKINEEALTAVSLAFPVQNLMISFGVGTAIGVNSFLSFCLGQKKQQEVDRTAMNGILLAIFNAILFLILGLTCVVPYLKSQTSNEMIFGYGKEYLFIVTSCGFFVFGEITFERLLQATGRTVFSMMSQIAGAVTNLIFDPLLIFGIGPFPQMGIKGAAIATVAGQIAGTTLSFILNLTCNHDIHFNIKNIIPDWKIIGRIYKVGVPSILMTSITSVIAYFVNLILGKFTMTAVAVYGVFIKMNSFVFMPVFGMNSGIIPIIAYNYGAGNHKRITDTIRASLVIAFSIMFVGFMVFELFPRQLFYMFNASDEMLSIGIPAFRRIAPSFLGASLAITLSSVFQAFGNAFYSMIVSFSRQLLVFLPAAYLLSLTGNVNNVWWCYIIAESMSIGMSLFLMRRIYVKKIKPIPVE